MLSLTPTPLHALLRSFHSNKRKRRGKKRKKNKNKDTKQRTGDPVDQPLEKERREKAHRVLNNLGDGGKVELEAKG